MPRQRYVRVAVCAAIAFGTGVLLGVAGGLQPHTALELPGLLLTAVLVSALPGQQRPARSWATMPLSFVIDFTALLLVGPAAAVLVVIAGLVTPWFVDAPDERPLWATLADASTVVLATLFAGLAHRVFGGTTGGFVWPWHGVPIGAAVAGYCCVKGLSAEVLVPCITKQAVGRSWPGSLLHGCPAYLLGASVAVGFAEAIDRRLWEVVPIAALPLYFAYRAHCAHVNRLEEAHRRREVIDHIEQGMAVLDSDGRVTFWDNPLERILDCPRERALGRSLDVAVPALAHREIAGAIAETSATGMPRTLSHVGLPTPGGGRILQVAVLPVSGSVTLLWQDVTERTRQEQLLKRSEARLALAAEGANDGLWEWDLRTHGLYVSSRWSTIVGLPAAGGIGRCEDWLDRVHPEDIASLKGALKSHLAGTTTHFQHEHRIRHEDGTYRRVLSRGVAVRGAGRQPSRIAGSLTDTTEREIARDRLRTSGSLDSLTGLCNRAVFVEGLGHRLRQFKERPGGGRFAVLYLDLDRFKIVNDSLGHMVGDELLTAVSRRLESCSRPGDTIARLGGDEFAVLLNNLGDDNQANAVAFRIQDALRPPFSIAGREVFTSASIGIAPARALYCNPDEIMRDADTAMYHAKARGKARHEMFDADMHARELDRLGLENDLREAVNDNECEVHYQPIVSLASGRCVGFESLVRWTRDGKAVSPATFVPIAEELGLIDPLGTWVLQQACEAFADWQRRFPGCGLDCITVNVSSRQLKQENFFAIVEQAVRRAKLKPRDLRLEITETALMDSPNEAAKLLQQLRDFGVKIYLDDFGTGYSSLTHLHKLPVDALKIDRSFVSSLLLPGRPAIVESILALARTLDTSVVAEGIESEVQQRELERLGCTSGQGYLFSRALPAPAVEALLAANLPLGPRHVPPETSVLRPPDDIDAFGRSVPFEWPEELLSA